MSWDSLIKFTAPSGGTFWASLPLSASPSTGAEVVGFASIEALESGEGGQTVTVGQLLAPVPVTGLPIVCIGLNYRNHAAEASVRGLPPFPRPPICL
jgi:2-keto-4-pentenoate hydratase/2-oxohepta-3-ene-1,7-dioic acid hydratase in catechol pathway